MIAKRLRNVMIAVMAALGVQTGVAQQSQRAEGLANIAAAKIDLRRYTFRELIRRLMTFYRAKECSAFSASVRPSSIATS